MTSDDSERIDFLLIRYGQLNQEHSARNQVVHRTFYLSLIFGVALLALGFRVDSALNKAVLSMLSAVIFISLGLWTRTYDNGRADTQRQRDEIITELEAHKYDFQALDGIRTVFPSEAERDTWEKRFKDKLLYAYYVVAVMISLFLGSTFYWLL